MLTDRADVRRVHLAADLYLVKRNGKAHTEMTCSHLEDTTFVGNPDWRVATSRECRALGIPWCESCS
jgi:hypothetical protein